MGLINGAAACTRFNVISLPEELDFDLVPFRPIMPGSSLREKEGIVPFELEQPFEVGARRWAFRVRMDKVSLDSTGLKERLKELIKIETDAVGPPSPKMRQRLKQQAEEEMMAHPMPRSKIIECLLDETVLYVGSVSKSHLGVVTELLKRIGVEVEFKTPWLDIGQDDLVHDHIDIKEPGQSVWGCKFLAALMSDPDIFVEPEKGSIKLITQDGAKVGLSGSVLNQLDRMMDQGAELLSAKLLMGEYSFSLDGLAYRISSLKVDNFKGKHWAEQLDLRMEKIMEVWQSLDERYQKYLEDGKLEDRV